MAQSVKARVDRQFRAVVELLEGDPPDRARVKGVPAGGAFNAEDVVRLRWAMKRQKQLVRKTLTVEGEEKEVDLLEEIETGEREDEPEIVELLARKFERRTYVRWKGEAARLVSELAKKGWPFTQLADDEGQVAHPKGTSVADAAKAAGVKLVLADLELREAPPPD